MVRSVAMVVTNRYDPDPRVHKEACSLARAGYHVSVFAYDRLHELSEREVIDGVIVHRIRARLSELGNLPATTFGIADFQRRVAKILRQSTPWAIHCHDQDTARIAMSLKRRLAKPPHFVLDIHDLYWENFLKLDGFGLPWWRETGSVILRGLCKRYARNADRILVATEGKGKHEGLAEIVRSWGGDPRVVLNVSNSPTRTTALPKKFTIGYVGFVRYIAPFEWLIDAIARLDPEERPRVVIAGGGTKETEVRAMMERASRRLQFEIEIRGRFNSDELIDLIGDTHVQYSVFPRNANTERALPCKMFDSVAQRRPVIGNSDFLMSDWIAENNWGWTVREGDCAQLAAVLRQARGEYARVVEGMRTPPSWEEQGEKLLAMYQSLDARTT